MTTTLAKPPKPLRRAVGAVVLPVERFEAWHALAIQTPGLVEVELGVLSAIRTPIIRIFTRLTSDDRS